ncbi:hypothetical protein STRCI_000445 [Streptomyces cinnabarinus]|uniref:Uncharacterized protein n=1 Tax=Streptomyces cinnabarinus TaxID=67287 RepID=A0ABY7K4H3_9ACTN|nr:hypothetical protein [Streptomyces cinnabarinus]WAZ19395.1 hypothetical protein STRCI_000445 [Streptomyces cinnabarinus]
MTSAPELTVPHLPAPDPRVRPLIRELGEEYSRRSGRDAHAELARCVQTVGKSEIHPPGPPENAS